MPSACCGGPNVAGNFVLSACITALYVACRAFQQLNVIHGCYARILPTSLAMGVGDVALILLMVKADTLWIGVANGLGGAVGCIAAMQLHQRMGN